MTQIPLDTINPKPSNRSLTQFYCIYGAAAGLAL
jgi:hypothetical protein